MRLYLAALSTAGLLAATVTAAGSQAGAGQTSAAPIRNFLRVEAEFCTGGQPTPAQLLTLKADGVRAVVNLRTAGEYAIEEEAQAAKAAGLKYFNVPVSAAAPTEAAADEFLRITDDPANRPVFIHCAAGVRAGAFWLIRRLVRDRWTWDAALAEARKVGLVNAPQLETFARTYAASHKDGAAGSVGDAEWTGRVLTGIVAVGGESTGIVIETTQGRLELQTTAAQRATLESLKGQQVKVRGKLEVRPGVELPERRIIIVSEIVKKSAIGDR